MSTLDQEPVRSLLERLQIESDASIATLREQIRANTEDFSQRLKSKTTYREVYESLSDYPLAVSRDTAKLLYLLTRSLGAKTVVEFGTSFAISTIYLAAAVRDNGGGKVITCEFEPKKIARATEHLKAAGLAGLVELRAGDALQTLASGLPTAIDLVLLDGAKALYVDVLKLLEPRLRPGALIVADNAALIEDYLAHVRSGENGYLSTPVQEDVELSVRLG